MFPEYSPTSTREEKLRQFENGAARTAHENVLLTLDIEAERAFGPRKILQHMWLGSMDSSHITNQRVNFSLPTLTKLVMEIYCEKIYADVDAIGRKQSVQNMQSFVFDFFMLRFKVCKSNHVARFVRSLFYARMATFFLPFVFNFVTLNIPAFHCSRDPPPFHVHLRHCVPSDRSEWMMLLGQYQGLDCPLECSRPPCSTCQCLTRLPILGSRISVAFNT
jgi:hypothetical protein